MRFHSIVVLALGAACLIAGQATASVRSATGCPAKAPSAPDVALIAHGPLVPAGATSLLLCRYRGTSPASTAHHLLAARRLASKSGVDSIAGALNALPETHGVFHCPLDTGSVIDATFGFRRGSAVEVSIGLSGCRNVIAPHAPVRTAALPAGQRLIARLERLLR